ncbi:MAG: hypothetical protein SFW67_15265 [Myxococcaceae bacterium]|nr:hypothetical protein [Myxococcaceae bacterium]
MPVVDAGPGLPTDGGGSSEPVDGGRVVDGGHALDGGSPLDGGAVLDSGMPLDGGDRLDGGAPADAGVDCSRPDAEVQGVIGPAGGQLSLCGATVRLEAGSVPRATTFRFARAPGVAPPVAPIVLDGFMYRLEGQGQPVVTLTLPHGGDTLGIELFEFAARTGWVPLGLCDVDANVASQRFTGTGVFGLLRDPRSLPTSPQGLGSASVSVTVGPRTGTYGSATQGYAGETALPSGQRVMGFNVSASNGSTLQVELLVEPNGAVSPWSIVHLDELGVLHDWSFISTGVTPFQVTMMPMGARRLGRLVGQLRHEQGGLAAFDATFDVTPGAWRELSLRVCGE